jgi:hypothetical protein
MCREGAGEDEKCIREVYTVTSKEGDAAYRKGRPE